MPGLLPALLLAERDPDERWRAIPRTPRDWFVDGACFLLALVIGAVGFTDVLGPEGITGLRAVDLAAGALSCLALWWRRRWPVELAVVVAAASTLSSSSGGAALVLLFTVAVHRPFGTTAVVAGLHTVAGLIFYAVNPDPALSWLAMAVITILIVTAVVAWGMFIRARRQLVISLRERAHQAGAEAALRIEQARHLERERIAREMHDVLAHSISLLSVHASALEYRPGAPQEDIARAAAVIRSSAHQALQDLREVIGVLRAPAPNSADPERPQPTLADVPTLIDESRHAGMRVGITDRRAGEDEPPAGIGRCAYRIVQEGLTNARKHARGAGVAVTLSGRSGEGLSIEIRNHVPAGSKARSEIPGAGTGLIGLGERVALAGGQLEHGYTATGDFRLFARLPWAVLPRED